MSRLLPRCEPLSVRVPVVECGEPLVDLREQDVLRIHPQAPAGPVFVRWALLDRLITAQTLLPARIKLLVRQGFRARDPAHSAGGAVDLGLCTSDGAEVDPSPHWNDLAKSLRAVGLVDHPKQPRHWSYGDRYWAHRTGAPAARYGADLFL